MTYVASNNYLMEELRIEFFNVSSLFKAQFTCHLFCDTFYELPSDGCIPHLQYCHSTLYFPCTPWCYMHLSTCLPSLSCSAPWAQVWCCSCIKGEWREEHEWHVLLCGGNLHPFLLITIYEFSWWLFHCPSVLSLLISKTQSASVARALLSDLVPFCICHYWAGWSKAGCLVFSVFYEIGI